jgi:Protein of unknown function (DUF3108)
MNSPGLTALLLAATASVAAAPAAPETALSPFTAHYVADWKGISVASSEIQLKQGADPAHFIYYWSITARGILRLAYHDDLVQTSWLSINDGHARPDKYSGRQGSTALELNFDWQNKRVTGTSEGKPVDINLVDGAQDVLSIQVEVMLDLQRGNMPKTFQIIDKDQLKEFNYAQEGSAKLKTAIGDLDTIVVTSQRAGNDRILRMWFAPSLGFAPVQAERSRGGNIEFSIRLKSFDRATPAAPRP